MQNQSLSISTFLAASVINDGTPLSVCIKY